MSHILSSKSGVALGTIQKKYHSLITKSVSLPDDVCRFTLTTDDVDRDGDIVDPGGLEWGDFLKNPVVLWHHAFTALPIGKVIAIALAPDRKSVIADVQFAVKELEIAAQVCKLYKARYLNAVSIGFRILAAIPGDRAMAGRASAGQCKRFISRASLLEVSAVTIPSNPEALQKAIAGGLVISKQMQEHLLHEYPVAAAIGWIKRNFGWSDDKLATLTMGEIKGLANAIAKAEPTETAEGQEVACSKCGKMGSECKCPDRGSRDRARARDKRPGRGTTGPADNARPGSPVPEIPAPEVKSIDRIVDEVVAKVSPDLPLVARSIGTALVAEAKAQLARRRR